MPKFESELSVFQPAQLIYFAIHSNRVEISSNFPQFTATVRLIKAPSLLIVEFLRFFFACEIATTPPLPSPPFDVRFPRFDNFPSNNSI